MDQQNQTPREPMTPEEIARLEAQAVAAMRSAQGDELRPTQAPAAQDADFVPYVDDAPEPEPAQDAPQAEEDEEYIPGAWERRIDALTPRQWKLWQAVVGAVAGVIVIAALYLFGDELALYGVIVAVGLALLLPRYLERAWRRKLNTARIAMAIAMGVCLATMALVIGLRTGFKFFN